MLPLLTALLLTGPAAQACDACATGDPTILVMGAERPKRGLVRLSTEVRYLSERTLDEEDRTWVSDDLRALLGVAWAPHDRVVLAGVLPLATAARRGPDLSSSRGIGLGVGSSREGRMPSIGVIVDL